MCISSHVHGACAWCVHGGACAYRWVKEAESKEQLRLRMEELVQQIRYAPHETIVLVGHSHFFRALFQRYLHADVARKEPELAKQLCEEVAARATPSFTNCMLRSGARRAAVRGGGGQSHALPLIY